jgi:hypothetical protein
MADGDAAPSLPPAPPHSAAPPVHLLRRDDGLDLGWCAGSTVQPRKTRAIEGVGAASFLALQAQVYRAQARACVRAWVRLHLPRADAGFLGLRRRRCEVVEVEVRRARRGLAGWLCAAVTVWVARATWAWVNAQLRTSAQRRPKRPRA